MQESEALMCRIAASVFGEMLKVRAAISHKDGHASLAEKLDKNIAAYKF